jgi:hypothetical protein
MDTGWLVRVESLRRKARRRVWRWLIEEKKHLAIRRLWAEGLLCGKKLVVATT